MPALEESLKSLTLKADSTLGIYTGVPGMPGSADPNNGMTYRFVAVSQAAEETATLATKVLATAGRVVGVLQNKPQSDGAPAQIGFLGRSPVVAGAAVGTGKPLTLDTVGRVIEGTIGTDPIVAISVTAAGAINQLLSAIVLVPSVHA